ncbi:flagellar assembly protein FliX, partial [Methylopila musalis]
RGRGLLDALEALKADMLHGRAGSASLEALRALLAEAGETTGDAGLDDTLAAIDLRAQVELAKLRQADPRRP